MTPAVLVARGARSCEAALHREIARVEQGASGVETMAPIRVVVPSRALCRHVQARMVGAGSRLGIAVQSLRGLAAEILERGGEAIPGGDSILEVLVMRAAARKPALSRALADLDDGWRTLTGSVCDLLDAGFTAAHLDAVAERLLEMPADDPAVERVRALVEVASEVEARATYLGVGGSFALWRDATATLARDGPAVLPCRAVLVHGFAEATGLALDFVETLVQRLGARVIVDEPDDLAWQPETSWEFSRRLRERLAGWRGVEQAEEVAAPAPTLGLVRATGVAGEVRAALERIRALLDRGVAAESIGLVVRRLAAYEAVLAVQAERLGVPVAVEGGEGIAGPLRRQVAALAVLLRRGAQTPVETWRAMCGHATDEDDVRLALRVVGVRTVEEAAGLDCEAVFGGEGSLPLPVSAGLTVDVDQSDQRWMAPRRRLSRRRLEEVVASARRLAHALTGRAVAPVTHHLGFLESLMEGHLGLGDAARKVAAAACEDLAAGLPADMRMAWPEMALLVRRSLEAAGREAVGGAGGGVQVMGVTQARGLTFEHLYILGLNRDAFPRVVREDPLFPDWVRAALVPLIPDVPVKVRGHEEERYLFAALLGAAPSLTLCWQGSDDDGRELSPSPLVERLRLSRPELQVEDSVWDGTRTADRGAAPFEHAVAAGLAGSRDAWEEVLALVMAATDGAVGDRAPALAAARRRVLDEVDPDLTRAEGRQLAGGPGPYLGLVGVSSEREREERPWVTVLEALARCPWQTFLRRLLRLRGVPDPEAELRGLDPLLVGSVVHAVLADVAGGGVAPGTVSWEAVLAGQAAHHRWPSEAELEALLARHIQEAARDVGGLPPGLAHALALRARGWLEAARSREWIGAGPAVLGVEVEGRVVLEDTAGRPRDLRFKADLVERAVDGRVRVSDYKTGRPVSVARTLTVRRKHLLQKIRCGELLQAAAYAGAEGVGCGRYLYLKPEMDDTLREAVVDSGDPEAATAFATAVTTLLAAWEGGVFLPRLTDPAGRGRGPGCGTCELTSACVVHDTTARRRLLAWAGGPAADDGTGGVARAIWALPAATRGEEDAE